jgi:DNA-binding response OmpR family regulator
VTHDGHVSHEDSGTTTRIGTSRKHVFVIQSEPTFLDVVRELLLDERYHVTTTDFLPETYNAIVAFQPDLLILDLLFGKRSGWDLLVQLTDAVLTRDIPVIVTSTDPDLLEEARRLQARFGDRRFLIKPFDLQVLLNAVHDLIGLGAAD